MASTHGKIANLLNPNYKEDVRRWLAEDCPSFDYGGFVVGEAITEARLLGKSPVSPLMLQFGLKLIKLHRLVPIQKLIDHLISRREF